MGDLSPHFSRSEFAEHDNGALPAGYPVADLVNKLETLRAAVGRPLRIVSGYRSPEYNAKIGGAPHSFHMRGMAADVEAGYCSVAQAEAAGFSGIGVDRESRVIHLDVRGGQVIVFHDGW